MNRVIITPPRHSRAVDLAYAERYGVLVPEDLGRALRAEYRDWPDREVMRERDLRCVVGLARKAWCAALDGLDVRETPCRCLVGQPDSTDNAEAAYEQQYVESFYVEEHVAAAEKRRLR